MLFDLSCNVFLLKDKDVSDKNLQIRRVKDGTGTCHANQSCQSETNVAQCR